MESQGCLLCGARSAGMPQFCSCRASAALGDARREECGLQERRGGCVHSLFSFQSSGCALRYSFSGGKNDRVSRVSLRRERVLEDRFLGVGMNSAHVQRSFLLALFFVGRVEGVRPPFPLRHENGAL